MSPQFVDFDGDGNIDIVCGIFDGSPKLARGDGKTWAQPQWILDKNGDRIVLNAYWNFDTKKWDETKRCDPDGGAPARGHMTSAIAFDWDGDGDWDLLLGDHDNGFVYLRRNEGSNEAPAFATRNETVLADGAPMKDPGTVATLRAVDWNGDGRLDLMLGGMGDPYGTDGTGGGVVVHLDRSATGEPDFGPATTLIARSKKDAKGAPTRPDVGLHPDAVDFDGDGDLDLVVGGYSVWAPAPRELSDAEREELAGLRERERELAAKIAELNKKMLAAQAGLSSDESRAVRMKMAQDPERREAFAAQAKVTSRLQQLVPPPGRVSFTWLYENLSTGRSQGQR